MQKVLTHITAVRPQHIAFGAKLGLDLQGCSAGVARARIDALIAREFDGVDPRAPTPKQVALAAKFGWNIASCSREEGEAVITDLMQQLNIETVEQESLAPGVEVQNIHDTLPKTYLISTIQKDGTVFFKGGNGRKAYARSLRSLKNVASNVK